MLKDYTVVYTEEDEEEEPEGPVPFTHVMGKKQYELTNHLGNVLATVSDVKLGYDDDEVEDGYKQSSGSDGLADYYMPYMYTATQYYPFGSPLPGRDFVLQSTCDTTVVNDTLEVVNEAFATGVGGFVSLNAGGTVSNESGQLKFQKTCTTPGCPAYGGDRTFTQVSGETYTVKFDLSLPGTCSPTVTVKVLDPSNGVISTQTYNTSGTKTFTFTTTAGGTGKIEFSATTCTVFYIDNLNIGYTAQTTCITCHGGYRFGFNGKEKTDEWQGAGMSYDYGFRIHDPRLGRFLSVDPLTKSYPQLTPYQFASNTPIYAIDLDGLEAIGYEHRLDQKNVKMGLTNAEYIELRRKEGIGMAIGLGVAITAPFIAEYGGSLLAPIMARMGYKELLKMGLLGGSINATASVLTGETTTYELASSFSSGFVGGLAFGLGPSGSLGGTAFSGFLSGVVEESFQQALDNSTGKLNGFNYEMILLNGGLSSVAGVLSDAALKRFAREIINDTEKNAIKSLNSKEKFNELKNNISKLHPTASDRQINRYTRKELDAIKRYTRQHFKQIKNATFNAIETGLEVGSEEIKQ